MAELTTSAEQTLRATRWIEEYSARAKSAGDEFQQTGARAFAYSVARTEAAALLVEHANAHPERAALVSAQRWCARNLAPLIEGHPEYRADSTALENG